MKIEYIKVKELHGYEFNTRTHSDEQVSQLAASIGEFGFTNPLLIDGERQIIAGHGRLAAATKIGMEDVPCIVLDHLTEAQRRAYVIADNKLALNAGWDEDLLKIELSALDQIGFDLSVIGFDADELSGLVIDEDIAGGLTDEDDVPELAEIPISKQGDIWLLDNHRVMCGDSTIDDDFNLLMNGERADMVFTDPPYNALKSWKKSEKKTESRLDTKDWFDNDNMEWDEFDAFLLKSFKRFDSHSLYICCDYRIYDIVKKQILKCDYKLKHCIVWKKNMWGLGKRYRFQHEFIVYLTKEDSTPFYGNNSQSDVWDVAVDRTTEHNTPKPVELPEKAIINSSEKNNLILDIFLGSGTTLIASEKTNRRCYGMELSPKYVDLIVNRWQDFTGKQAVHEVSGLTFDEVADAKQVA